MVAAGEAKLWRQVGDIAAAYRLLGSRNSKGVVGGIPEIISAKLPNGGRMVDDSIDLQSAEEEKRAAAMASGIHRARDYPEGIAGPHASELIAACKLDWPLAVLEVVLRPVPVREIVIAH